MSEHVRVSIDVCKSEGFPGAGVTNSSELPVPEIELKASASAGYPLNHGAIFPSDQLHLRCTTLLTTEPSFQILKFYF